MNIINYNIEEISTLKYEVFIESESEKETHIVDLEDVLDFMLTYYSDVENIGDAEKEFQHDEDKNIMLYVIDIKQKKVENI